MLFEGYERRIGRINQVCAEYGLEKIEDARDLCLSKGIDVNAIIKSTQPIAFENAVWAYTLGCAIAIKKGCANAAAAAEQTSETAVPAANRFPPVSGETSRISSGYSGKNTSLSRSSPTAV